MVFICQTREGENNVRGGNLIIRSVRGVPIQGPTRLPLGCTATVADNETSKSQKVTHTGSNPVTFVLDLFEIIRTRVGDKSRRILRAEVNNLQLA